MNGDMEEQTDQPTPEELVAAEPTPEQLVSEQPSVEEVVEQAEPVEQVIAAEPSTSEVLAEEGIADPDVPATPETGSAPQPGDGVQTADGEQTAEAEQAVEGEQAASGQVPLSKIKKLQQGHARRPRRRKPGAGQQAEGAEGGQGQQGGQGQGGKGGQRRRQRPPRQPREKGPLPFQELRAAAQTIMDIHGNGAALRVAFGELAPKERQQLSELVAADGDFRVRARSISAGSLAAGKLGKALAAQQVAIADVEDLWSLTLSKEEAAERQARVRNAKRRDQQRAERQAERNRRSDRISREDLAKAQDGRVGAQIRIVVAGENDRDRKKAKDQQEPKKKPGGSDLLDRLGY